MSQLVLPQSTHQLLGRVPNQQRHPGLQLDKFSIPGDPTAQKRALEQVCSASGDSALLKDILARRQSLLSSLPGCISVRATTTSPLTLHLSRASALENAGICLHPIYGFAYLPGSGLKGMARAFAETVWLLAELNGDWKTATDAQWQAALDKIDAVFGFTPYVRPKPQDYERMSEFMKELDRKREARDREREESKLPRAHTGNIIFHDAWPETWPQLIVDIVNNHHSQYYQADPNDNAPPPGDWEDPVPVYFLAVKPGVTFTFPLAKRRADVPDELVELARQWLLGALCHLGAGAKTNTRYGAFEPAPGGVPTAPLVAAAKSTWEAAKARNKRAEFTCTLELVTPAFLAGANQQAEDCDLRPATLRGLLRWWWRTMHAGFLDVKTLRALEAAIWGDTKTGGAVRIVIEKVEGLAPQPYDKGEKAKSDDNHKKSPYGIPSETNPKKITPGLWYLSYGMDEKNRRRYYLEPGAKWRLQLIAWATQFFPADVNDSKKQRKELTAEQVLNQAQAALWLLCQFGGVGSKARKGFGSLSAAELTNVSLESCKQSAQQLRQKLGLPSVFEERNAHSPSLQQMLDPVEVTFNWPNVWSVLDQVGFAYQTFAKKYKHNGEKMALGLPRRISPPIRGQFTPTPPVTANGRHSSPVHIHLQRDGDGFLVRVIAFPAAHLPNLNTSRTFLQRFLEGFGDDLRRRAGLSAPSGPPGGTALTRSPAVQTGSAVGPVPVRVRFLGPHESLKTPQQAFWVQEEGKKRGLLKYGRIPDPLPELNSEIEVYRTNDNPNSPEYRWDRPSDQGPSKRGPGPQRPRGRR